jgi:hypothetical protein
MKSQIMRILVLVIAIFIALPALAQYPTQISLSGIILDTDSVPVTDVAIINARTGKTVRSGINGFFHTEITSGDSLLIYHIAFKKQFINEKHNGRSIVVEPEIQELMQIDITDLEQEKKNLEQTMDDIKRIAPMEKLSGYDLKSKQTLFIEENGSHNKGFSPFFGPTVHIPIGNIARVISKLGRHQRLKEETSHYHLVKRKKKSPAKQ